MVYEKGRQLNTTFNSNLVMNILHLLGGRRLLASTNATRLAEVLLGTKWRGRRFDL